MRESVCIISSQRPDKYPNGGDEAYWTARIGHDDVHRPAVYPYAD